MTETDTGFVGLRNYAHLFHDQRLWQALLHTVIFTAVALPLELVLGLAMAQLFLDRLPGRPVFIALLVLPVVVSPIVSGATWSLMFDQRFGPINQVIGWITGGQQTLLWTINPKLVYPAIIAAEVWQWTPFMFLLLLAALANVDKSQLEASAIDGAGYWRTFFKIVLPAIWPVMAVAILIRGLDLFRLFDIVWALTKGGPGTMTETISIFTYIKGFQQFETSYTAAVALLIIVLLSVVVFAALKRVELAR
jgi:multiple sugar transport system permease protein